MAIRNDNLGGTDWIEADTTLDGGINAVATTITVDDTTAFPSSGVLIINAEIMSYTGKTATTFTGVIRGIIGTTAAAHNDNDAVVFSEIVSSKDLNDTFNGIHDFAISNTVWWMNSNFYDVYDDFSSYTVGNAIVDATKYDTSTTGSGGTRVFDCQTNNSPGGSAQNARFRHAGGASGSPTTYLLKIINLSQNVHKHMKIRLILSHAAFSTITNTIAVSFNKGTNYDTLLTTTSGSFLSGIDVSTHIHMIAKSSNEYDCYVGSRLYRSVTDSSPEIWLRTTNSGTNEGSNVMEVRLNDIFENKYEVS